MKQPRKPASVHDILTRRIAALVRHGGGTLQLDDGIHAIDRPLLLPAWVSLCMTPHAVIRDGNDGMMGHGPRSHTMRN